MGVFSSQALANFPGSNGKIYFTSQRDGNYEVYSMNANGSGQTDLTNSAASDSEPHPSPDGTKVLFASNRDATGSNFDVFVMNADGTNPINLTHDPSYNADPTWSPDGKQIAFISNRGGTNQLWVMNADGSNPHVLTPSGSWAGFPSWSPDGTKIAIAYNPSAYGAFGIYTINPDGTGLTGLTTAAGANNDSVPDWSPDGTQIAFQRNYSSSGTSYTQIFTMNADGTNQVNLTGPNCVSGTACPVNEWPSFSPDGTKIAFDTNRDGQNEIYVMGADGTNPVRLTIVAGGNLSPEWGREVVTVNTSADGAPTDGECSGAVGDCSLRQAINKAQSGDTIQLGGSSGSPAVYRLTLGATLSIAKDLAIVGNGVGATTIDGSRNLGGPSNQPFRIMTVGPGATVSISGITFSGGIDANDENFQNCSPCQTIVANGGGALFNDGGAVTLSGVAFTNDSSSANPLGGGVSNGGGTLNMTDVSFTNDGAAFGGGLFVRAGSVTGNGVTFENDGSFGFGGGGAYILGGSLSLTNATVVGDGSASSFGGGIVNAGGTLALTNDTFSGNLRGAIQTDQGATTTVADTIIGAGFDDGSDFACVAAGKTDSLTNGTTANAITTDLGNNLDQDNHCGLSGPGDISGQDPKLASPADNGGATRTQALLVGSPAINAGNVDRCPPTDQRGIARPQGAQCDIGSFEAVFLGSPTNATTDPAQSVASTQADLAAHINLAGEAGGFHFLWGTSSQEPSNSTPEVGAGVVSSDTAVSQTLANLHPGTTYYYQAVADNASGSRTGAIQRFTTLAAAPVVSNTNVASVTDTTATLDFTIDPNGADTTYLVKYGPDSGYGQQTQVVDIGAQPGPQQLSTTVSGLAPNTSYHFDVVATNDQGSGDGGDSTFATDPQVSGTVGSPVTLTDSGSAFQCPSSATVDWGDGHSDSPAPTCTPGQGDAIDYAISAAHTYASPGHYHVAITYPDLATVVDEYAQIAAAKPPPPPAPAVTGTNPTSGPAAGGTRVTITGANFKGANAVSFGSTPATKFTLDSDSQITVTSPAGLGTVDITVTTPGGTSATSSADRFTYSPVPPVVSPGTPMVRSSSASGFTGFVNPQGLPTVAYFQYGLDSAYSAAADVSYTDSTPQQQIGSAFSPQAVTASVSGLVPNALYHVRLVASNSAGTTYGPDQTFKTQQDPAPASPALGKTFDVAGVQGLVLIEINGKLVPLTEVRQIPVGSVIDALHGSLNLTAALGKKGKTENGTFGGAVFKLTQLTGGPTKGLTILSLLEGAFPGAPSFSSCKAKAADSSSPTASAAALSSKVLQTLHASAHGHFRTRGRFAAATVRGTKWTTTDRCDGTLVSVQLHTVTVTDFVRRITVLVHQGHSYLAKARP